MLYLESNENLVSSLLIQHSKYGFDSSITNAKILRPDKCPVFQLKTSWYKIESKTLFKYYTSWKMSTSRRTYFENQC